VDEGVGRDASVTTLCAGGRVMAQVTVYFFRLLDESGNRYVRAPRMAAREAIQRVNGIVEEES
jgi:hypothetical protein